MSKYKLKANEQPVPTEVPRIFTLEEMTVYSEIVRIIGESNHSYNQSEGTFHWILENENSAFVALDILLTSEPENITLEIYEINLESFEIDTEVYGTKTINDDLVYTLIGYACSQQIGLTFNEVCIEGRS